MGGSVTAFLGDEAIASGAAGAVTRLLEERYPGDHSAILVFDDETGRAVDLDYWDAGRKVAAPRPRGRPRLGVASREVTLLPRHWEWLAGQSGGASAALRRLVEGAMRGGTGERERRDAAYRFLQASSGDRAGYEEALRAVYRGDADGLCRTVESWPGDIKAYLFRLLYAPEPRP